MLGGLIDISANSKESVLLVLDTDLHCDYKIKTGVTTALGLNLLYTNNIADPIEYEASKYFIALTTAQFEDND